MKEVKKQNNKNSWKAFFQLIPQIKLPWILIILGFCVNMAESELMAIVPVSTSELFAGNFTQKALWSAILANVAQFSIIIIEGFVTGYATYVAVRRARIILWDKMLNTTMSTYDHHNANNFLSTISEDSEAAINAIIAQITSFIPSIYAVYKVVKTIGNYNGALLISVLILIPVNVIIVIIVGNLRFKANANIYSKIGELTAYLAERVANIPLIKTYTNEDKEQKNGINASNALFKANMYSAKVKVLADGISSLVEVSQRLLSIVFGSILLARGVIGIKEWMAFFLFLNLLIPKINSLISTWNAIKGAQGNAVRLIEILNFKSEESKSDNSIVTLGDIKFENVSFSYDQKEVLKNVSFNIPKAKSTAIVGVCGSGKSTILSLIERLYQPNSGKITIANMDISLFDLEKYRQQFAYVQQGAGVFSGSLRDALTYGVNRTISDEEILEAAKKTGAIDLIETIENGLDGYISIFARSVSGGQRQRIVLTRELLKNKEILILDEPTSALDSKTAIEVQRNIFKLFKDKTLIFVTHDLRMLEAVDQIIVVSEGEIVSVGTHQQLLNNCDKYNQLINAREIKEVA